MHSEDVYRQGREIRANLEVLRVFPNREILLLLYPLQMYAEAVAGLVI